MKKIGILLLAVVLLCGVLSGCTGSQGEPVEIVSTTINNEGTKAVSISCSKFESQYNEIAGDNGKIYLTRDDDVPDYPHYSYKSEDGLLFSLRGNDENNSIVQLTLFFPTEDDEIYAKAKDVILRIISILDPDLSNEQKEGLIKELELNKKESEWNEDEMKESSLNERLYVMEKDDKFLFAILFSK